MEIDGGLTTREAVIEESDSSMDLEETFAQLEYEQELAEKKGLVFSKPNGTGKPSAEDMEDEDDDEDPPKKEPAEDDSEE